VHQLTPLRGHSSHLLAAARAPLQVQASERGHLAATGGEHRQLFDAGMGSLPQAGKDPA
jgi:hypothetical protein